MLMMGCIGLLRAIIAALNESGAESHVIIDTGLVDLSPNQERVIFRQCGVVRGTALGNSAPRCNHFFSPKREAEV